MEPHLLNGIETVISVSVPVLVINANAQERRSHPSEGEYGESNLYPRMTRTGFPVSDDIYVVLRGE
jgi:hypothetical protein